MGDSSSKCTPGLKPDHSGKPQMEENFKEEGILPAYKKAVAVA